MDFALTDEQQAIVDLTRQILTDRCTPERLKEVESGPDWFDRDTWAELAKADLLGIALPEADGGGGFGFLEVCLLLHEAGRAVAPIPLWSTLVGARAVAELGTAELRRQWLPGVVAGEVVLALGLSEAGGFERAPQLQATATGDGSFRLSGAKTAVTAAGVATAIIVTARTGPGDDEVALFVVATDAPGVACARQDTFNHEPQFHVAFDDVVVPAAARLHPDGVPGARLVDWLVDRATVGLCALAAGIAEVGMRITADYVIERKQFDKSLGTFQAVCHRMADCYIDAGAISLTMLQAATRLAEAAPAEAVDPKLIAVAKYWASYSGSRVGHAGLHLHGGISIDLDYPIHRYFLWSKHLELQLGAGTPQLSALGEALAREPVGAVRSA